MKRVLILALMFCFSFAHAYDITVYGRNSCGFTANLRNELDSAKVPYTYCNIDSSGCLGQLFQVAIEFPELVVNGTVNLPVVLVVSDRVRYGYVRPTINQILKVTVVDDVVRGVDLYPNPASRIIYVSGDMKIYSVTGCLLMTSDRREVDISLLPDGVYLVKVGNQITKLLKR